MTDEIPLIRLTDQPGDHPLWVFAASIRGDATDLCHAMTLTLNCPRSAAVVIPYPDDGKLPIEWTETALLIAQRYQGTYVIPWRRQFSQPWRMLQSLQTGLEVFFELCWERHRSDVTVYLLTATDKGVRLSTAPQGGIAVKHWGTTTPDELMPRRGFVKRGFA